MDLDMYRGQIARLRADYDAAFRALCQAIAESQSDSSNAEGSKQKVDAARAGCNRARNALASVLLDRKLEAASRPQARKRGNSLFNRRIDTSAVLL